MIILFSRVPSGDPLMFAQLRQVGAGRLGMRDARRLRMFRKSIRGALALLLALFSLAMGGPAPAAEKTVLEPFVERGEIAGAVVMIVSASRVLEYDAVGYADLSTRRAMPKDAIFWIASTSKPFVSAAVMMMVEEGRFTSMIR